MSIKTSNGPASKRRKLSHSSSDGSERDVLSDNGTDDKAQPDGPAPESIRRTPAQRPQTVTQRLKGDSALLTGGMTKSSLMLLQVNELLEEISPDRSAYLRTLKPLTDKLAKAIKSIPEREPASLIDAEQALRKKLGVAITFGPYRPGPDVKYNFEYRRPERITLRGPIPQQLGTKDDTSLEVAVEMPSLLFQEKDYLNYRAFHKRAYYVACLAAGIRDALGQDYSYRYSFQDDNDLVPIIIAETLKNNSDGKPKHVVIVVTAVFPNQVGPIDKLTPERNCVRNAGREEKDDEEKTTPTPVYNSTLRMLASTAHLDQLLGETAKKCNAFKDACVLGQTWLRQRGFTSAFSAGGFGMLEWAYVCALLLGDGGHKGHPMFSDRYSSLQLFKAMMQVLASKDLTEPLLLRSRTAKFSTTGLPVIFDGATGINALFKMTRWSYDALRHHARLTLDAVNSRGQDNFEPSFILKIAEPFMQYDEIYTIELSAQPSPGASQSEEMMSKLFDILKRGLGDRVSLLNLRQSPRKAWDLALPKLKKAQSASKVEVCLLVNPDATLRLIDHGPPAEQRGEAQEFQKFWGEKSELRRFRDGSITETLVWSAEKPVTYQIIQYLVLHHFKVLPSLIEPKTSDLQAVHLHSDAPVSATDAFKIISNRYQELSSKLHQLEGIPLPIRSVSPASGVLASTSVGNPSAPATSLPIDTIIQFDSSARWPDHLGAIQHTKIAFLAKISDLVTESEPSITTRIGLENTGSSNADYLNTSFLDIIYPSPAQGLSPIVFRLRIHHERELHLLQNLASDKTLPGPSRDSIASAILHHKRTFVASPSHTTIFRNLITHFPPLSATIRLLKYWIAQHNLSNHIAPEILDILAAYVFLHPYPWSSPGAATTAFLRCLHLISRWDWMSSPLIIDLSLSQDMSPDSTNELETRFQAWRKLDPNLNTVTWFVGTNIDNTGTVWTQGAKPARVIASRVTALARAAVELIKSKGTNMLETDWTNLFLSSTSDFDFLIHLKPSLVRGSRGKKSGKSKNREMAKYKNLQVQDTLDVERIGHDVVALYLADLEKAFGAAVLFFYGDGGEYIAGLWRPSVSGRREWRVRLGFSTTPYAGQVVGDDGETKGTAEVNKEGMLAEMALLGEGLVEKINAKD